MNTEDIIEAAGYLACDLSRDLTDSDIRHDWNRLMKAIGEEEHSLTKEQLQTLRTYAA